jgi:hypothetical protein
MKKRIPTKRDRGIEKEIIYSTVMLFVEDNPKYFVKLYCYFLTKYCGLSLRDVARDIDKSKTNVVFHINSVAKCKKDDPEFLDMYKSIEKRILFKTNGVRKRIIYHKYNRNAKQS